MKEILTDSERIGILEDRLVLAPLPVPLRKAIDYYIAIWIAEYDKEEGDDNITN